MTKGEETRSRIVDRALELASVSGIEGLTIGTLASSLSLSKSGLFAHFDSREELQVAVLERAADRFRELVVLPALRAPRGEPRVRALFEKWLDWGKSSFLPGGCVFVSAAAELDDRPGRARDVLVQAQRDFISVLSQAARVAVEEGHFRADADPDQFAFELYALVLGFHHHSRLLREARSGRRVRAAFDRLVKSFSPD
ncbi:MAG TPA: TetR/AcrR family transcriptional regulator [Polyangiaceae bacterium]|nr:TetR/AcrR family transcriptional regulator [Polyangiaceae bacterium]